MTLLTCLEIFLTVTLFADEVKIYVVVSGASRICKRGAKVERRRRDYRGAKAISKTMEALQC